ncbi:MAG: hypothetical protein Q9196_003877 [Gyalolechia fulgens]
MSHLPPTGGQLPSFKTNVNRAKTKRWVEAKSYTYDGDDWGDMDEHDEYGGYDEPPRPTGLRQRGQSASREQQPLYQPQQGGHHNPEPSQHGYGNMARQGVAQHQYGARSVTNPSQDAQLARSSSFDHGDERRAFSATLPHQAVPPSQSGIHPFDQYTQAPSSAAYNHPSGVPAPESEPNQPGPPPAFSSDHSRQQDTGGRTQSMTSSSSLDFHDRRDFSPTAVPPPLHTRGSPSPQNLPDAQPARRPPRKSSLSQQNQPENLYEDPDFGSPVGVDIPIREPPSRERTASQSGKPLPFVRPADIYKRMQEEKEKDRQSQESSRPSMESRAESDLRPNSSGASEPSQDVESWQRSRSTLDPVAERKSEYGMAGLRRDEADPRSEFGQGPVVSEALKAVEPRRDNNSLRPQLPDVARLSGFGELFSGTGQSARDPSPPSSAQPSDPSQTESHQQLQVDSDSSLQHQPSLGFRSVVHQAFDTTQEQIPETPSSSNADSSINRSGSRGTSVVSPIISRGSSSAGNLNFKDPQIRPATPPTVIEEPDREDRPQSSGSSGTPKAVLKKVSADPSNRRPASFLPGHRRDLSTPSPDNSPARTPALEANKQLHQPQEAELALTTPIETDSPHDHGQPVSSRSSQSSPVKSQQSPRFPVTYPDRAGPMENSAVNPHPSLARETPQSPAESTRSRVRNLADRFESGRSSPAGSERSASPAKMSFLPSQTTNQSRPLPVDRLESFRPKLPGGWESSASLAPLTAISRPESSAAIPLEERLQSTATENDGPAAATPRYTGGRSEALHQEEPNLSQRGVEASTNDPFASLAAAGSALAGVFSTAVGSDHVERDPDPPRELEAQASGASGSTTAKPQNTSANTAFIPEASKPAMLTTPDDETSSIMPTPLDKVSQPPHWGHGTTADYFAASTKPKQQASGDSYTSQDSVSTKRSQLLPTLTTDSGPQYESDRLRREIIRELSPMLNNEPSTAGYNPRLQDRNPSLDPEQRESLVIPREYDSYWNDSGSERSSRAPSTGDPSKTVRDTLSQTAGSTSMSASPDGETRPVQGNLSARPTIQPNPFSWERPSEASPQKQEALHPKTPLDDTETGHGVINDPQGQLSSDSSVRVEQQALHASASEFYAGDSIMPLNRVSYEHTMDPQLHDPSSEKEAMLDPVTIEPGPASEHATHNNHEGSAPTGPSFSTFERESNSTGGDIGYQPAEERDQTTPKPVNDSDNRPPPPGWATSQPKIQSFREILALKEPQDRIKAYNETREQYANIETGLGHWLAVTTAELPDYKEVLPNGRFPGTATLKPSAARARLGSLLPGSSSTQQPYYQQYLNASSPAGAAADADNVAGGNSPQTYSPSSSTGKLSSQQMQARGKDLLHSAGVFGGKANVAAKGLFSKGRSKFRSGNADKAPISAFNTAHRSGQQQWHQPSGHSPSTPKEGSLTETSIAPNQSVLSRPRSFAAPLTQQTEDALSDRVPDHWQPPSQAWEQPTTGHVHDYILFSDSSSTDVTEPPLVAAELSQPDAAQSTLAAGSPTSIDTSRNPSLASGQTHQESDQTRDVQSPHSLASSNRTLTQADHAGYFHGGPSPTAGVRQTRTPEHDQPAPGGEIGQNPFPEPQNTGHDSPPTSKSPYSMQAPTEIPSPVPYRTIPQSNFSRSDQTLLQRGSEDPDGTFQTAESGPHTYLAKAATEFGENIPGQDQDGSTEELVRESSGEIPPFSALPVAVPAVNIQDQSRSRPLSFVQFSNGPTLKPLEDYSCREPSNDSATSVIDPNDDFPPSPMSSRQSVPHPRTDEPEHSADHDLTARNGQHSSGPSSHTILQPFQGSTLHDRDAAQREQSVYKGDGMHVADQPASIPSQDTINPRQQSTEYSLEGVGPPPESRPTNSTSTSKRGSRNSAFFRSFKTTPPETLPPQLPGGSIVHDDVGSQDKSEKRNTKSKRGSLFRSLTGAARHNASESKVGETRNAAPSIHSQGATQAGADMGQRREKSVEVPGKNRNRLSRAATAKMEEQQAQGPSKKKPFSAIVSLFGRSKDQKSSNAGIDRLQHGPNQAERQNSGGPQGGDGHESSLSKTGGGSTIRSERASHGDDSSQYTSKKLAKEGLLTPNSVLRSSMTVEPAAYNRYSAQDREPFPLRNQSLGDGNARNEQRPSDWSRDSSSTSSHVRPQQKTSPAQHQRVQSMVTTRSTTRHSGFKQAESNPRQFSSTTTTTTITSRMPNTNVRQQSQGNTFARSDSPPPPPPPPKDRWHQTRSHQRSMSNNSFAQAVRGSSAYPAYTSSSHDYPTDAPPATESANYVHPLPPNQTRRSLPLLQTNIPSRSLSATRPHGPSNHYSDLNARDSRRSRVESIGATQVGQPSAAVSAPVGRRNELEGDDEPVVMSATSFPGQEWQPSSFARWEGD